MSLKSSITITRTVVVWFALAAHVFGHAGFEHVMGTVVKVTGNVLTVKTAKGNVDVKIDDKTEFTKNSQKAKPGDLTPGVRIVVDIPEGSQDKVAHSIKIGTATPVPLQSTKGK
jgi:hypothetical protein